MKSKTLWLIESAIFVAQCCLAYCFRNDTDASMSILGISGVIGAALGLGGDKVEVPDFIKTDVQEEQKKAIGGNVGALGDISKISEFATTQRNKDIEALAPGTTALKGQTLGLINEMMGGNIPKDVEEYLKRKVAEWGVGSGVKGSQLAKFKELRTLGLTSMQQQEKGLSAAQKWIAQAESAPTWDFSSMLIRPEMQAQFQFNQNQAAWQNKWLKAQIAAMPSPMEVALQGALDAPDQLISQVIGAVGGVAGGAAGGAAAGAI